MTFAEAKTDILQYLEQREEYYFSHRGTTKAAVLANHELIDMLASEHLKCVTRFGNSREWSCRDACDNEPGIYMNESVVEEAQIVKGDVIGGLVFVRTCYACPEQYDVFTTDGEQVGYVRLRHGFLRADCPDCGGETVYASPVENDGCFEDNEERQYHLSQIAKVICTHYDLEGTR